MIAGHFGFAAGVKSRERATPLWALMLATVWLDVIFVPLLLMKIETLKPVPGAHQSYGGNFIYADYTHSLVGAIILSLVLGGLGGLVWGRRSAIVLALVSFSHWLLDLIVHRGDLPILPGNAGNLPRLGLGLWAQPGLAAGLELLLVVGGAFLYWRAACDVSREAGRGRILAHVSGALVLAFGLLVLAMDVGAKAG